MKTSDFDYELPPELIAQTPIEPRDHSRLLVYHRSDGSVDHRHFYDIIDYLNPGDALVINETRVIPARLLGVKEDTGVPVEVLLLRRHTATDWETLVRPGRRLKPGTFCSFGDGRLRCEILENVEEIGASAFEDCTSLESVSMPDISHVDRTAFRGCPYSDGLSPDEPDPEAFSPMDSRAWAEFFTAPSGYSSPGEMIPQEEDPPPDTEKGLFGRIKGFFRKK